MFILSARNSPIRPRSARPVEASFIVG
jgi:hypothetical protein